MRQRPTPLPSPDPEDRLYFSVELEKHGTLWFRVPFPLHVARLLQELEAGDLASFAPDKGGKMDLSRMDEAIPLWMLCGAAVGLAWHGLSHELVADLKKHGKDYSEYGESVLEEMHDAGYTMADFNALFPAVLRRLTLSLAPKEVADRADFS